MAWPPWHGVALNCVIFGQLHRSLTMCGLMLRPIARQRLKTAQVYKISVL